jgi:bifunctional DNA-binding transcriptional regulator/antitoxin component of YhaV-PrlF toxin-antitoxin module
MSLLGKGCRAVEHVKAEAEKSMVLTLNADGHLVLPPPVRAQLGLVGGEPLVARVRDGQLVIETLAAAVKRAQDVLAPYIAGEPSVVDELIAERRAEAERE